MVIVADTSPINYLILIEAVEVMPRLYGRVIIPGAVYEEMGKNRTPAAVRQWAAALPGWIEIREPLVAPFILHLGRGETEAIALASELHADRLLIDEQIGRSEAQARGLPILGTLGILRDAALAGLLELKQAFDRLKDTSFRAPASLFDQILREFEETKRNTRR